MTPATHPASIHRRLSKLAVSGAAAFVNTTPNMVETRARAVSTATNNAVAALGLGPLSVATLSISLFGPLESLRLGAVAR